MFRIVARLHTRTRKGPLAQRSEQPAHNWMVVGSIPTGTTFAPRQPSRIVYS